MNFDHLLKPGSGQVAEEEVGLIWLSNGNFALVDWDVFEDVSKFNWHQQPRGYVARNVSGRPHPRRVELLHQRVMGVAKGMVTDHVNGWKIDCVRRNLRLVTQSQNLGNQGKTRSNTTSVFKGVHWAGDRGKWRAILAHHHLGSFGTEVEAALAYNAAASDKYGECALQNPVSQSVVKPV
jgi:hypothetical protein